MIGFCKIEEKKVKKCLPPLQKVRTGATNHDFFSIAL